MKALAARLSDLSLRKTSARSRRICASASVIGDQRLGADILLDIRAGDESHADIGRHKAFQQFAGIEFHGQVRLQVMVIEQGIECVAGMAEFGQDQRIGRDLRQGDARLRRERMAGAVITTSSSR